MRGALTQALRRLRPDDAGHDVGFSIRDDSQRGPGLAPARERVVVEGHVRAVVPAADGERPSFAVELDIAGSVPYSLVWLGRRSIAGIDPGVRLRVHGLVTTWHAHPTVFNPSYELLPRESRSGGVDSGA